MKKRLIAVMVTVLLFLFACQPSVPTYQVANTEGNSPFNCKSDSNVARQGNYWFYALSDVGEEDGLYRIRKDGKERRMLTEGAATHINVVGDWIYFCLSDGYFIEITRRNLYKIRLDGTEFTKIMDDCTAPYVAVDKMYFIKINHYGYLEREKRYEPDENAAFNELCTMNLDGSGLSVIPLQYPVEKFVVTNNELFFYADPNVYRSNLDGSNVTLMAEDTGRDSWYIDKDVLYFVRVNLNDKYPAPIITMKSLANSDVREIRIDVPWIGKYKLVVLDETIICMDSGYMRQINTDGTNYAEIHVPMSAYTNRVYVFDNEVYLWVARPKDIKSDMIQKLVDGQFISLKDM